MLLTAALQDYIEIIYRLEQVSGKVRVTDIASELGTRLPTVTRTVRKLAALGLVAHERGRGVILTTAGSRMARDILHRHEDIVALLTGVLGLPRERAEVDACLIEHGVSAQTAQRLHEFLEYFSALSPSTQALLTGSGRGNVGRSQQFRNLAKSRVVGWRI
ncbi:MAG: metal-dependent transcriptional regulator [Candidatus Zixiibacteriota bacterium]